MTVNQELFDDLWGGEKSIGFFVHSGICFWVVDEKRNFTIDVELSLRASLKNGTITQEQYERSCLNFRGGVLALTAGNFLTYLNGGSARLLTSSELQGFLGVDKTVFARVEDYFLSGNGLDSDLFRRANVIRSRLPLFYINFDRKIFMHMDDGRSHENYVHSDWVSQFYDFSFLIPTSEKYWVECGDDYWKLRFL